MSTEPSDARSPEAQQNELLYVPVENQPSANNDTSESFNASAEAHRRRILIGSQRDPAAYLAKPRQPKAPVVKPESKSKRRQPEQPRRQPALSVPTSQAAAPTATLAAQPSTDIPAGASNDRQSAGPHEASAPASPGPAAAVDMLESVLTSPPASTMLANEALAVPPESPASAEDSGPPVGPTQVANRAPVAASRAAPTERVSVPNLREQLSYDMERELEAAMADGSMDELLAGGNAGVIQDGLEPDSKLKGRVLAVRREDVFVELGSREQGVASLRQFHTPPEPGDMVEVIVRALNREDGFYELTIPGQTEDVADWSDLQEGMVVSTRITGHNTGGLECEVNRIRGFIPVSQVSLYRVEGLEQFVGEQWPCLVTEADPDRRNLVLSRRALLEREREQARQQLFLSLAPGQVYDGVVRKILDFGAFVDLGDGVDGLLHVSQLSWSRVQNPRDVLSEGQKIRVRIDKIDPETRKIGLSYRDLFESPWANVADRYPNHSTVRGTVSKLMEFGAFVELEPGVEGLVHISELSHKRVWRASDVVREGQEVEVLVLSVDADAQRISLSMKQLSQPEPVKREGETDGSEPEPEKSRKLPQSNQPLKGGLGSGSGGVAFGLKW
ncbi:MAG: S1 RNA-binding domain-containing protein [Patescibacteria group bacterium]|nr:S1 RNA-binding domain-containing protein [Patescibacteria group bacterium]